MQSSNIEKKYKMNVPVRYIFTFYISILYLYFSSSNIFWKVVLRRYSKFSIGDIHNNLNSTKLQLIKKSNCITMILFQVI